MEGFTLFLSNAIRRNIRIVTGDVLSAPSFRASARLNSLILTNEPIGIAKINSQIFLPAEISEKPIS